MPFDRELAIELLEADDRDTARFFAGRDTEIQAFDVAVRAADTKPQATFRIYQGPPGSGKTSLAAHLADRGRDRLLFVKPLREDVANTAALSRCVRAAAQKRGPGGESPVTEFAKAAASYLRAAEFVESVHAALSDWSSRGMRLVLHFDETFASSVALAHTLKNH